MSVLAVDGDLIAYRYASACEGEDVGQCLGGIDYQLYNIMGDTGYSRMRIYLSGKNNFRYDVATTRPYKGNRKDKPSPIHLKEARAHLVGGYGAVVINGYEADDAIASDVFLNGAIHVGYDKDLYQIEGRHYNFLTHESKDITDEEAAINLYRQVLTGDSADNIPGLPGIGEKKAADIITSAKLAGQLARAKYHEVCAVKMPDADPDKYFDEQLKLVGLVKNMNLLDFVTYKRPVGLFL